MQSLQTVLSILLPMLAGFCLRLPAGCLKIADRLLGFLVYVILFVIGTHLARVENLWQELDDIAFYAVLLFALLTACNTAVLACYDRRAWLPENDKPAAHHGMASGGAYQVGAAAAGVLYGAVLPAAWQPHADAGHYILILLIFLVGVLMRGSGIALRQILLNKHGLHISWRFAVSCLLAGALFALLTGIPMTQGLALSSGYGWYSLSGIMMTQAYGATWGSVALLNDLMRELTALFLIPWAMRRRLPAAAIASGGATSMDFMLPLIQAHGGAQAVAPAIAFGVVANLLPPVLMAVFSAG